LLSFEQLPRPWSIEPIFARPAPLEVEVGSGKGMFLRAAAAEHPETNFLGIEIAQAYAQYIAAGLARDGLENARIVAADGTRIFRELIADNCLAAVHVYFPDPWWKRRHRKRRLMQDGFVRDVERTLQPGGKLHFWTDVAEYFQVSLETLASQTRLEGPLDVPGVGSPDAQFRTHFERRTRQEGQPVYRAEFRKPIRGAT
jgi:tRNA (guanine-N7-)-methyltransferase